MYVYYRIYPCLIQSIVLPCAVTRCGILPFRAGFSGGKTGPAAGVYGYPSRHCAGVAVNRSYGTPALCRIRAAVSMTIRVSGFNLRSTSAM